MLTTRTKIALAAVVQQTLMALPGLDLRDRRIEVTRAGIRWALDLGEGIDFSIWLLGAFERRTVAAYSRLVRSGMTVIDIGANIGAHTLPLARLVGPTGRAMLKRGRPVIVLELSLYILAERGDGFEGIIRILHDCGYRLVDLRTWRPLPSDAAALAAMIPDAGGINIIASPA